MEEAKRLNVKYFRGSQNDVLERYYLCAKENFADVVVRVTSDCPLIDAEVCENIIDTFLKNKDSVDYVSNCQERSYPRGFDTEVFSFLALKKAYEKAKEESEREHVTPYIWKNKDLFTQISVKNDEDFSKYRLTLDTVEDFTLINEIYKEFGTDNYFGMKEILELFLRKPELYEINKDIEQKKV